jgi:hypothetical protein
MSGYQALQVDEAGFRLNYYPIYNVNHIRLYEVSQPGQAGQALLE